MSADSLAASVNILPTMVAALAQLIAIGGSVGIACTIAVLAWKDYAARQRANARAWRRA